MGVFETAWEAVKKVREVAETVHEAEVKTAIADLSVALSDLKMQFAELQEENTDLKKRLAARREAKRIRGQLKREGNSYVTRERELKGYGEGPFCMTCFDVKGLVVNLVVQPARDGRTLRCMECSKHVPRRQTS